MCVLVCCNVTCGQCDVTDNVNVCMSNSIIMSGLNSLCVCVLVCCNVTCGQCDVTDNVNVCMSNSIIMSGLNSLCVCVCGFGGLRTPKYDHSSSKPQKAHPCVNPHLLSYQL